MSFDWKTYTFADYVPTQIDKLVPNKTYVALSTSDTIYPNGRWLVMFHELTLIDSDAPLEYINVTINSSTAEGFVGIIDNLTTMALTTKDRAFYDYNLLEVEKYTTNYNKKLLPPDVNAVIVSFLK
jgi:hypothetical protein